MCRKKSPKIFSMCTICFLLILSFPLLAFSSDTLPSNATDTIDQKLEELNIDDVAINLNKRISVPYNEYAEIEGVDLFATVIKHKSPVEEGSENIERPTIVIATPYRRELMVLLYLPLLRHDYNILAFDIRGTGSSHGGWVSFGPAEHYDAAHVIDEFIPAQPWSNGKVGMIGPSYMGITQMLAAGQIETDAQGNPEHLKAIFPIATMSDVYRDIAVQGGNLNLEFIPTWLGGVDILGALPPLLFAGEEDFLDPDQEAINEAFEMWEEHLRNIPVTLGWILNGDNLEKNDFYDTKSTMLYWRDKPEDGWNFEDKYPPELGSNSIPDSLPTFLTGGWFDIFTRGTCNAYQHGLKYHSDSDKAMLIGPWYHLGASLGMGVKGLMNSEIPARWFNWKIKEGSDPFMQQYPVMLYVMGEKRWRAEKSWPLPEERTEKETYYLSKSKADSISGDWFSTANSNNNYQLVKDAQDSDYYHNLLFWSWPKDAPELQHDPLQLHGLISRSSTRWLMGVPALGSQVSKLLLDKNIDSSMPWEDERLDEVGALTFTTKELKKDIEIAGPLKLTFWAKTDFTKELSKEQLDKVISNIGDSLNLENNSMIDLMKKDDVQWVVELNDVFPDGRARNITSGWLSAENRPYDPNNLRYIDPEYTAFDPFYDNSYINPSPIKEGKVYKYVVELWPTDNVFKKGHRIRLSISASDFPHLFPVLQPSENELVLDENHKAKLEFKTVNQSGDYRWVDNLNDYMLTHEN